MNFSSIGFKLIVVGCLAVLIPLAVNGVISVNKASTALTRLSKGHTESTAADITVLVNKALDEEKKVAAAFASGSLVRSTTREVNAQGIENAASQIAPLRQEMKNKYKLLGDQYLGIFVANAEGVLYTGELSSGKEYKGSNISSRAYFQQAKSTGNPVVGDVVRSKSTGALISVVCAPVRSGNGEFLGVFGMSMKASALTDLVTAKKVGKTGYAFMVNSKGIVIAHPKEKYLLSLDLKTLKGMESITQNMLAGEAGVEDYTFEGTEKIAGYSPVASTGWSVVTTQNAQEFLATAHSLRNTTLLIALLSLAAAACVIFFAARAITTPINQAVAGLKDIAEGEGDLTMRLQASGKDEIGELATWFNTFMEKLQGIIGNVSSNTQLINKSSEELSAIASGLSASARETSDRSDNVATATEEMNVNLNSVAAAMEESATNTSMVASAAEEMTTTINEIAANAEQAHSISETAVQQALSTSAKVAELGQAAQAISKVTETITEISEQTNLLALNATIEAARAGEAGKGFAVVANEIKELAKQTAEATLDIKTQIEGVQGTTNSTVGEIDQISKVINSVNEIVATISSAVGEQSAATEEIAANISQASMGLGEVNENVSQSSVVADSITQDITSVNSASTEISGSSNQVKGSADDLLRLADELKSIVSTFKI